MDCYDRIAMIVQHKQVVLAEIQMLPSAVRRDMAARLAFELWDIGQIDIPKPSQLGPGWPRIPGGHSYCEGCGTLVGIGNVPNVLKLETA